MYKNVRVQDDLFLAVNGEWLETAVIPDDRPSTGGFSTLDQNVEKLMMGEVKAFASGEKSSEITGVSDAVRLYRKVLDEERRNSEGIKPLLPLLHRIAAVDTVEKLNAALKDFYLEGVELPFDLGVDVDWKDATKHCLMMQGPSTILPDTTYYGTEAGEQIMGVFRSMAEKALAFTDLSAEDQKKYLEDALAFDAKVAQKVKSSVEWADYVKMYNPTPTDEVAESVKPIDFKAFLKSLWGDIVPDVIIVADPKAIKELGFYFSEETLESYVHWAYLKTLLAGLAYLSEEMYAVSTIYRRALTGVQSDPPLEKQAYRAVSDCFSEPLGLYYGRTYFGEEAKKDVVDMVRKIIDAYKDRIAKNGFLREETKKKAIKKLSTMEIKMGYPDDVRAIYKKFKVDEASSYYEAFTKLMRISVEDEVDKLSRPVDRGDWHMPGHMVNACFDPFMNDITFPAAILQKPFYSIKQSKSENLGGIGAVIAHEISHAFDNNGSHFDENGSLFDWWGEEDFAAFDKLTKEMIAQWDGIEFCGEKVNGELVVSENIADNGGMAATLQVMHETEGADFQAYFLNWGRIWCQKANPEYIRLLMKNDVHSPAELRANIQVRNFPEWYEAFGVTEKDKMYIAPEKRIIIW